MASLYTQHYSSVKIDAFRTTFDITYEGKLADIQNTRPLFATLIKGLLTPITSSDRLKTNIVYAEIVARERGILVNEQRSKENGEGKAYSSFIILRARATRSTSRPRELSRADSLAAKRSLLQPEDQIIQGFVSGDQPFISRLDKFKDEFVLKGTLIICRNFNACGKIGFVGSLLGKAGVNFKFMNVAPLHDEAGGSIEALMILGIDRMIEEDVMRGLIGEEGVLEVRVVTL